MIGGFDSVQAVKEGGEHGEKSRHFLQFLPSQEGFLGECGTFAIPLAIRLPSHTWNTQWVRTPSIAR